MRLFKGIGLGILLLVGLLAPLDGALAQQATDSALTNAIQTDRMTVLEVNAAAGQIYCLEADGRLRVVEFPNGVPMVVTNGMRRADLGLLSPGDLIKVQRAKDGQAHTIIVLRRGSDEITSPEQ
ncbi:MAG: hypothetical protein HY215_05530 [Candidatus Rokubacteria bacterium]|nr:hypothetical protein [Candidatus Rokubacteria bacterium]